MATMCVCVHVMDVVVVVFVVVVVVVQLWWYCQYAARAPEAISPLLGTLAEHYMRRNARSRAWQTLGHDDDDDEDDGNADD